MVIQVLVAIIAGAISALAFPRFGPGVLIVPGVAGFLWSLRSAASRRHGLVVGLVYGIAFFSALLWWSIELGLIALVPLVIVLSLFPAGYGWWLGGHRDSSAGMWLGYAVSVWALMEVVRYRFPFSGLEWGGAGYALSGLPVARAAAPIFGTSGWTVLIVAFAAALVVFLEGRRSPWVWLVLAGPLVAIGVGLVIDMAREPASDPVVRVAIVQGSTPCPYEKCPPDERLKTFEQHLELTRSLEPGTVDLVVWAEGSTGSSNADPVRNPEIGEAIGAEAIRIGAWLLVGSDRPVSEDHWLNANVAFDDRGEYAGEYRKQQGVPFGEYIPFRPLFEWVPDLSQVPRDMLPGDGPVVFDIGTANVGSVISFEGSFARYALQHARAGADILVVATNEGSYGTTPASDQLIGMTRMRAAELGIPVVHAAVTGKSVLIDETGEFASPVSGLASIEVVEGAVAPGRVTLYSILGDWLLYLAAASSLFVAGRQRRLLVSHG